MKHLLSILSKSFRYLHVEFNNQRANVPANPHLISGPSIITQHTNPDYKCLAMSDFLLQNI